MSTDATQTPDTTHDDRVTCALGALFLALDEAPDPVARLEQLRRVVAGLTGDTERTVAEARSTGATWERIGDALYVSKQAAQQRYGR